VCGAFGRATNTDPVLWRVILVVLSIFGGVGVLVYLLGWLLLPADGDTATPVESVIGRGHSSTSSALTVIAAVIVLVSLGVGFSTRFSPGLAGVALVAIVALLLLRDRRTVPSPTQPPPSPSSSPAAAWSSAQSWSTTQTLPNDPPSGGTVPNPTAFAPYGPFSSTPPPPPSPTMPPPPRPRRPRSALGRLTFSVAVVAVGLIALLDVSGVSVPFAVYPATALAIVGLGLIIGTWVGRGRGLIALGVLLSIMIGIFGTVTVGPQVHGGTVDWRPASLSQVDSSYDAAFGDATLDLSQVDFSNAPGPVDIHLSVNAGSLEIILPPTVDTTVNSRVKFGDAQVFKDSQSGVQSQPNTVTDLGTDGPGGGQLNLTTDVSFGSLEVRR
jgi:phage shock protein PspC (stress-responsive transcriptional regulator)